MDKVSEDDLETIVKQSQAGHSDAFERLVQRFRRMAVGYGYSLLGDYSLAEDVAQDAFLTAYLCLSQLNSPAAFPSWFRRIVFKQADRLMRGKRLTAVDWEDISHLASEQPDLAELLAQSEIRQAIDESVSSLPSHEHAIFVRFYFYQQSYKSISAQLELPVSTVKSRLYSARKRIKELITNMMQDTPPLPLSDIAKRLAFWDEQLVNPGERILFRSDSSERGQLGDVKSARDVAHDLPILPLRGVVLYPMMWVPIPIGLERSLRMVRDNLTHPNRVVMATSRDEKDELPGPDGIYSIGTVAHVHRVMAQPDGSMRLLVQGVQRVRVKKYVQEEPYLRAQVSPYPEDAKGDDEENELMASVQARMLKVITQTPEMPDELSETVSHVENARQLAYLVASCLALPYHEAQKLLEMESVSRMLAYLIKSS